MYFIGFKKLCTALIPGIAAGCAANLTAPELGSNHPANFSATESAAPTPPLTLKSYRAPAGPALSGDPGGKDDMAGMDHSQHGTLKQVAAKDDHGAHGSPHGHGGSAAGNPGDASKVTREIKIAALDAMRYDPTNITVKMGETIRFVVTNMGQVQHEFIIADAKEHEEHAQMMRKMPNMKHEDSNALTLAPGETKVLLWEFGKGGEFEVACHVPGHFEAGMRGKVTVSGILPSGNEKRSVKEGGHDEHKH
ncbi:MAG: plastocyanin/azurin family copper-binding protein [Burkholderiales bacterium]